MSHQVAKLKAAIAKYTALIHLGCKKYILNLIDAEEQLEQLTHTDTVEAETLTVWTNQSKGVNAYLSNVMFESRDIYYGKPLNDADRMGHQISKAHQVSFDLKKIPDGTYFLNEYASCGRKNSRISYIVVASGKILSTVDKIEDLMGDLPRLEGSEKQISWAASIRSKFLSDCYCTGVNPPQWVFEQQSAKYWIESRHGLKLHLSE